jgi:hypothetical protein
MRIVDAGTIFDGRNAPANQRSCAFTSLVRLTNGRYLAAFRAAPGRDDPGGRQKIMGSDDGRHWTEVHPGLCWTIDGITGDIYCGYFTELESGVLTGAFTWVDRSDPSLSFVHPETAGILPTRALIARSTDGGMSWDGWREIDLAPQTGCSVTGPVFTLPDGSLALPYETWKTYEDPSPGMHTASLRVSRDGGLTWPERQIVAADPDGQVFYWDQRIARHPETGRLVAMFWTHDRRLGRDIDNHIAWADADGSAWTLPSPTGWIGQHCQPLPLGGDRLAAIYVHRNPPPSLRVRLTDDFGKTWDPEREVVFYEHPVSAGAGPAESFEAFWQEMMSWQFGHPRAALTAENHILVAYYAGDADSTSMRWSLIEV